jgi:hypothetical protein
VGEGGALAAAFVIVLGATLIPGVSKSLGTWTLPLAAFIGALVVTMAVYRIGAAGGFLSLPSVLPAGIALSSYATAEDLLDALTATARAAGKDRFFSYLTTRSAENSLFGEGEFVGFGFRNRTDAGDRIIILDVFAASPAAEAGLLLADEVIAVDGHAVADALASGGTTFSDLLGPVEPGVPRTLRIQRGGTTFGR